MPAGGHFVGAGGLPTLEGVAWEKVGYSKASECNNSPESSTRNREGRSVVGINLQESVGGTGGGEETHIHHFEGGMMMSSFVRAQGGRVWSVSGSWKGETKKGLRLWGNFTNLKAGFQGWATQTEMSGSAGQNKSRKLGHRTIVLEGVK